MGNTVSEEQRRKYSDFYSSGDRIGAGTFATVKRCTRKKDKKLFAVKIIDKRHLTGRELVGLKDEIRILKAMDHPHCIKMADVFDDGRRVKMVLELCEGGDLFDQILKSPKRHFDEKRSAQITVTIARSLKYLHDHYVVHRDLKPENILFTKDGILKITDFGLAHYLKLPPSLHIMHTCCGTPHYVAPEVLSESEYDYMADFWSLGVILYIMLSGYQPFNSHSIHAMYGMIIRGDYKFPKSYWKNISNDAIECVKKLMCVEPKNRLNSENLVKLSFITKNVDLKKLEQNELKLKEEQKKLIQTSSNSQTQTQSQSQSQSPKTNNNNNNNNSNNDNKENKEKKESKEDK